jgi:endogenous inhibitor of DNA gyrase (YacG/DUF329 family)
VYNNGNFLVCQIAKEMVMGKIKNCEQCGAQFEDKHRDGKRFCSRHCSGIFNAARRIFPDYSGDKNPNWKGVALTPCDNCGKPIGKAASERGPRERNYCSKKCYGAQRTKLRTLSITCEICGKSFEIYKHDKEKRRFCSVQCAALDPKMRKKTSQRHKGKTIPEWHRQAVSKAVTARSTEKEFSYGKSGHHVSAKAGSVFYRSSYEKIAYQILDADDKVISYQPEPFVIMYVNSEGNARRYRPDILVKKSRGKPVLIEVKPEWKMKDEKTILKIEAGKKYAAAQGWRFEVWTEKKLGL